jgi:pyruvate-ferredoxin/flavodoxin oxidoreductase
VKDDSLKFRRIRPFSYKLSMCDGDFEAERVVVFMGSVGKTPEEVVDYLRKHGDEIHILEARLFRPFSTEHLADRPPAVKSVAVLGLRRHPLVAEA